MKRLVLLIFILFLVKDNVMFAQNRQNMKKCGILSIIISGLKNNKGEVQVGLFGSKEEYNGKKDKFKGAVIKVEEKEVKWIVKDVPYGEYAVKAFHDENKNGKVDMNFFGIPVESYGFSNNVKGLFGPPGFEKVKFTFNQDSMLIKIILHKM